MAAQSQTPLLDFDSIYSKYISDVISDCEKSEGISNSLDKGYYIGTGLHVLDFILNGGIRSGWFTTIGLEQSGKSALAVKMLGALAKEKIPGYYIDAENSLDTESACSIMNIDDVSSVFGVRSPTGKGWEVPPIIRYTSENILETVFKFMKRILLGLPDKIYRHETNKWYLVFDRNKQDVAMKDALQLKHSQKLYSETGRYWCEVPDGKFQFAFFIDSLANLVTSEVGNEADGESNAMALDARAFSKYVKTVRGLLRRKHAVVIAINQLREKPLVMYGPSTYEPGGNALKFAVDCRNELSSRSVPAEWPKGKLDSGSETTKFGEEPSVEGKGVDKYVYKYINNTKAKAGTPFRNGWCRLWFSDYKGKRRGFDPVFDCFKYLETTNQVTMKRVAGRRELAFTSDIFPADKILQWQDFKTLVISEVYNNPDLCRDVLAKYDLEGNPMFDQKCSQQLKNGDIFEKMLTLTENSHSSSMQQDDQDFDEDIDQPDDLDEDIPF